MGDTGGGLGGRMSDHRWLMTDNGYSAAPRPRRVDIPVRYTTAPSTLNPQARRHPPLPAKPDLQSKVGNGSPSRPQGALSDRLLRRQTPTRRYQPATPYRLTLPLEVWVVTFQHWSKWGRVQCKKPQL